MECWRKPGIIKQWNCEGKCIRTLEGHKGKIVSLFIWRDCLYSGSMDGILVWSIITGQCVRKLIGHNGRVYALTEWRGYLISGSYDKTFRVWNDNGECGHIWNTGLTAFCMTVWKDFLCSGHYGSIQVWSDYGTCALKLKEHTDYVNCLLVHENFLYSGSSDSTICKWSISGECLTVMKGHTYWINCLVVYRGDLYSALHSNDKTIIKWTLDGKLLQILKSQDSDVESESLTIWNDTLLSGGEGEIIQWTGDSFKVGIE